MTIEELAFKNRKNLTQLNEKDLLDIIEFLQNDRKQWINQFAQTHNDSIEIQEENQELKKQLEEKEKLIEQCDLSVSNMMDCYCERTDCSGRIKDSKVYDSLVQKVENQQQEFIKWLEDEIHTIETTFSQINGNYGLMSEKLEALKEVLQKYKEIIGDDK